jgi:hypothetical protein
MLTGKDLSKFQNHSPTKERRKDEILNFLENNPGCTKEAVYRGVNNSSKNTVQTLLDELENEDKITMKKDKSNSREYHLFLNKDNILIIFNKQINGFIEEFKKLTHRIESLIPELILLPFENKDNKANNVRMILLYEQIPLFIIKYLIQCIILKSILIWPKIIQKEEIQNKLTSFAFIEISKLISSYSNLYNKKLLEGNIHQVNYNPNLTDELTKYQNNILYFAFFWDVCKKNGIDKEFENVIDKIWLINSDIQEYIHPEARRYNLHYEYGKDDWRKYLNLYKQYINKIGEYENIKKDKLQNFMSDLNIRDFF